MDKSHGNPNSRATLVGAALVVLVLLAAWLIARRAPVGSPGAEPAVTQARNETAAAELDAPHAPPEQKPVDARAPLGRTPAETAPLRARPHGVVRETGTHAPLPEFELRGYSFADESLGNFSATTGAQGAFAFRTDVPAGQLRFEYVDDRGIKFQNPRYFTLEFAPSAPDESPAIELLVPTGPTYFFDVALPAGVGVADLEVQQWRARPFQSSPYVEPPSHAALRAPSPVMAQPLLPWVRFGEPPGWEGIGWLELRSKDGRWHGGRWVERLASTSPEPVHLVLESAAWLVARVELPADAEDFGVNFRLVERVEPGDPRTPRLHSGFCARNELRIEFLEPGEYHLSARDAHWSPFERDVTIVPGENDVGTIALEPRPVVGAIRGVIESRSGKYEGACHVSLSRTPFEHDAYFDHSLDFEDDGTGKLVAHFELEDVTAGEWFLYVHCHDGFTHTNSLSTVVAPKDDVHIVLEDASVDVELELRDAASGALLDAESGLIWDCGGAWEFEHGPTVVAEGLPDAPERFSFVASAPGYEPQHGTAATFERSAATATTRARLKGVVALKRGFGGRVRVRDRASWGGVAGVDVFADDVRLGATDARGELWFTLPAPPARVRVEKAGWRWVPTEDADPRTGKLGDGPEFDVEMVKLE